MGYYTSRLMAGLGGIDADAQAFLTASGITDATITSAINKLVTDLKGYSLWTKMKALYPFVGGTAATHKWNLKDPRDLDVAFRLAFSGTITHNAHGITGNGSSGYADTFFNPSFQGLTTYGHISNYCRTHTNGSIVDMGATPTGVSNFVSIYNSLSGNAYFRINDVNGTAYPNADARGFYISNRTTNAVSNGFKNGTKININTAYVSTCNGTIYICALHTTLYGASLYSNRNYAFNSIGDGLTDTDASNLYTAVQAFQTTLGRQV